MNAYLLLLFVGVVFARQLDEKWHSWKSAHETFYAHPNEEDARRQIWMENSARIQEHNAENHNFTLSLNQFSDMVCYFVRIYARILACTAEIKISQFLLL